MTREEAKTKIVDSIEAYPSEYQALEDIIDTIFDHFEQRTCERCEYSTPDATAVPLLLCGCMDGICRDIVNVRKTDGCNKFKERENK